MGSFVPNSGDVQAEMLRTCGLKNLSDVFAHIPDDQKLGGALNIPSGMSEMSVMKTLEDMASSNTKFKSIFRGAGAYNHYIPAVVDTVAAKETLLTAYTPYQAEISQGVLQSIFEYQTYMAMLTGLDVSNAGVYDGATAAAEGCVMCKARNKNKILVSSLAAPNVKSVIKTYCFGNEMEYEEIPDRGYLTDTDALASLLTDDVCGVYVASPNYFGYIEDVSKISGIVHDKKAKLVVGVNPMSLAILKSPGEQGADIAVGDAQPLGLPMAFGGPYLGFMVSTKADMRKLPGRIVGETVDHDGRTGYVLTLQAREQHIRREKASSNICSNQAHCALLCGTYLSAMGKTGLKRAAEMSMNAAHYLCAELEKIGYKKEGEGEFFNEFTTSCPGDVKSVTEKLSSNNILGGLPVTVGGEDKILWCATELNTKDDIDTLIGILK